MLIGRWLRRLGLWGCCRSGITLRFVDGRKGWKGESGDLTFVFARVSYRLLDSNLHLYGIAYST